MAESGEAFRTGFLDPEDGQVARILASAECCFCGNGYAATTMREIAEVAGISKSLLHYHFQSKEHLFLEVLARIYRRLAGQIAAAIGESGTPAERVAFALDALYGTLRENPDFQVQARIWARSLSNEELQEHARRMRESLRAEIIGTIERVLGPAAAALPLSVETAGDLLWAVVTGLGLQAGTDPDPSRVERAFTGFRRIIAVALGASVATAGDRSAGAAPAVRRAPAKRAKKAAARAAPATRAKTKRSGTTTRSGTRRRRHGDA